MIDAMVPAPALWAAGACLAASAALLVAEWRGSRGGRIVFKLAASTAFLLVAWLAGAWDSGYGRMLLLALALSWLGDALLLSSRSREFLAGIGAFLLAHLVFACAFARLPMLGPALLAGGIGVGVAGAGVLAWLWPRLQGHYRGAVAAYVAAIAAMVTCAVGASAAVGDMRLAVAALAFAASDVAVARNRFVAPGFVNRAWGQPLYYLAQLVFALSVAFVGDAG
ncbi:hypothetical protein MASR1M8_08520 [Thermomonas brevis]